MLKVSLDIIMVIKRTALALLTHMHRTLFRPDSSFFFLQMTDQNFNCMIELQPIGAHLTPVTVSGYLPLNCVNLSIEIATHKPTTRYSSIYLWQLDFQYSFGPISINSDWRKLPMSKESVRVEKNDSLQGAIDSAANGSTVFVEPGSYIEHLYVNKTLNVIAVGGATETHLFGEVTITAPGVTLQGMTFYPSIKTYSTITVKNSFASIINCRFVDSIESLALYFPRPTVAIDCKYCHHISVANNDFYRWKHAVLLESAENAWIQTNTFRSCQTALYIGVAGSVRVSENLFTDNIVAVETVTTAATDELTQDNSFSGNVIPLLCGGKVLLYPTLQSANQYSKPVRASHLLFVTALCNATMDANSPKQVCSSIGHAEFPLGMYTCTCCICNCITF